MQKRCVLLLILLCCAIVPVARAQDPVSNLEAAPYFDSASPDTLHCSFQSSPPSLDFAFRFLTGYVVVCPMKRFEGRETNLRAYIRVTPQDGEPVYLTRQYHAPKVNKPSEVRGQQLNMPGAFAVGKGEFLVDVVVRDEADGGTSRSRWRVRAGLQPGAVSVPPHSVLPLAIRPWPIHVVQGGLRVTILLDAAPMYRRKPSLQVDSVFLVEALSSLLQEVPCASIRLRAFNLDQQRELFRADRFDDADFPKLQEALGSLELGKVSYQVLQNQRGATEMLLNYAREEMLARERSDAVIFLGPRFHSEDDVPRTLMLERETPGPRFYYFERVHFDPRRHGPDLLENLTRRLGGMTYEIYTPSDLSHSVQKMLAQVSTPVK